MSDVCILYKDGSRRLMWPIRLGWAAKETSRWFSSHGWQVRSEKCSYKQTSLGCMPGWRAVYGWTFHLGRLKVKFGKESSLPRPTYSEVLVHSRSVAPKGSVII